MQGNPTLVDHAQDKYPPLYCLWSLDTFHLEDWSGDESRPPTPGSHYVIQGHCLPLRMTSPLCSLSTPASLRHPLGGQVCSGKPHLPSPAVRSTKSQESKLRAQEGVLKKEV